METLSPQGHLRPKVNEFKDAVSMIIGNRARWNDGAEGTPLPESFAGNEAYSSIGTVEKLAEAYESSNSKTYLDFLGEDAKNDPDITKYKTGEDFKKAFKERGALAGKKGIIKPEEGASDSEWKEYHRALGIPADASEYSFTDLQNLHKEVMPTVDDKLAFSKIASELKLNKVQADQLYSKYFGMLSDMKIKDDESKIETKNNTEASLRAEWGANFDENATIARRLVQKFGGDEAVEAFGDLGNNPKVLKFLGNLGRKISEDSFQGVGSMTLSTDEMGAKRRIADIEADPDLMNDSSPRRQKLVEERDALYKVAYPS